MTNTDTWPLAHEVIASIPFTFGFRPRESLVVTACSLEPGALIIGSSARLDLDLVEGGAGVGALAHALAALARTTDDMAVVSVFTDRQPGEWVRRVLERLDMRWPFAFHGGCYVLTGDRIHGFSGDGAFLGVQDELELRTTRVAMSQPACELVDSPEAFRFARTPEGPAAAEVALSLRKWAGSRAGAPESHLLVDAVEHGGPTMPETRARLLLALENTAFRDGVIAWSLGTGGTGVPDFTRLDAADAFDGPPRPEPLRLKPIAETLARIAHFAPVGRAAAPIAVAAYLAWYSGDGVRARILCEQALAEDRTYPLAGLVSRALAYACPPPWFDAA